MEMTRFDVLNRDISRVGLGTWAIGGWMWGGTDEKESINTIRAAVERGVNLIDTAPIYGFGRSEDIVGKALAEIGDREKIVLATKVALEWNDGKVNRNASKKRILKEIDDSLRRLQTEYIDIYQIHWPDPAVPIEETADAMNSLFEKKKIRAIGVSNFSPDQMRAFRKVAPLHTCQPPYNVFEREIEDDVLPYCAEHGIAVLAYGALCRGLLTGKMTADRKFEGDDLRNYDPKFQEPRFAQYLSASARIDDLAKTKYGKRVIDLAVRWILDRHVEVALWGGRHPAQMEALDGVSGWSLDEDSIRQIDSILESTITDPVGPEFMAPP